MSICTARACPSSGRNLRVRKAGAHNQQRVAVVHEVPARLRAEQTDRARYIGQVVRQTSLAEQGLGDAAAEPLGHGLQLIGGTERAGAGQNRDPLAAVQYLGRTFKVAQARQDARRRARVDRAVLARRFLGRLEQLGVVGQNHARHVTRANRRTHGAIDHVPDLLGHHHGLHELVCDVLEQRVQIRRPDSRRCGLRAMPEGAAIHDRLLACRAS
jgi:hypothetical protein